MLRNMATSLVLEERINTTLPKAKELRGVVERLITLGKRGDLHARRQAASYFFNDEAVRKVFSELAERYKVRPGGYTRILRTGERAGDCATIAMIELVDRPLVKAEKAPVAKKTVKKAAGAPKAPKAEKKVEKKADKKFEKKFAPRGAMAGQSKAPAKKATQRAKKGD
jgi:large subunit ribosomal protein L17